MGKRWHVAASLGLWLWALAAQAGEESEGSVVATRPLGVGHYTVHAQFGLPGLMLEVLQGVSPRVDLGMVAWMHIFSFEGRTQPTQQGVKLTLRARFLLAELGPATLGVELSPGVFAYTAGPGGVTVPLALTAGWRATDWLHVGAGAEAPLSVSLTSGTWYLRFLGSAGAEALLGPHVSVTLRVRAGPLVNADTGGSTFSLDALAGIALRM